MQHVKCEFWLDFRGGVEAINDHEITGKLENRDDHANCPAREDACARASDEIALFPRATRFSRPEALSQKSYRGIKGARCALGLAISKMRDT